MMNLYQISYMGINFMAFFTGICKQLFRIYFDVMLSCNGVDLIVLAC